MSILTTTYRKVRFECLVIWLFICSDVIDCLLVGTSFGIGFYFGTMNRYDKQFVMFDFVILLFRCLVFNLLYLLPFSVSNQLPKHMILEDEINKPYRPLASKSITISQAKLRWYIYTILYILISFYYHCLVSCIVWITFFYLYNLKNWSRFWYFKNLVMSVGAVSLFCGQWSVIVVHTTDTYSQLIAGTTVSTLMYGMYRN